MHKQAMWISQARRLMESPSIFFVWGLLIAISLLGLCHAQNVAPIQTEIVFTANNGTSHSVNQIVGQQRNGAGDKELLPTWVRPLIYHIQLQPDLEDFTFTGSAQIEVEVVKETTEIVVHAKELNVTNVRMQFEGSKVDLVAFSISYNSHNETVSFSFLDAIPLGKAQLMCDFVGTLNEQLSGFYRSSYVYEGKRRYMAVTQFQPTDARKALPCWDEPAIKAKFDVTLIVPEDYEAISNMPILSQYVENDLKRVHFEETPLMSTYLLAFVVGQFDYVEGHSIDGVQLRVYTPLGKKESGHFALRVAGDVLSYFTSYFGIPYPLAKMDMIAVPDFAAGAMENWGCVLYREALLLIDEKTSSLTVKEYVAYVVAHELAHQWFGNLVSPAWWDYLWLNEGFATWVGNLAVNNLFPEWEIWTKFVAHYSAEGLKLDGLLSSHPVEVHVNRAGEIKEIFDLISYSKGAAIIRMLANYLGEDTFKTGLNYYLKKHIYSNAITEDLWNSLSLFTEKSIDKLMNNWVKKTGYPVLSVSKESKDGNTYLVVSQQRFTSASGVMQDGSDDTIWWVPLLLFTSNDPSTPIYYSLFEDGQKEKTEVLLPPGEYDNAWIKVNAYQSGFFRVKYSEDMLMALAKAVESQSLKPSDRLGMLDDGFALAKAGQVSTEQMLELVLSYSNEETYSVWASLTENLIELGTSWSSIQVQGEPVSNLLKRYVQQLYGPIVGKLGWESKDSSEDSQVKILRGLVLAYAGNNGMQSVIDKAQLLFTQLSSTEGTQNQIPPDLLSVVYNLAVKHGGQKEWEEMRNIYRNSQSEEHKLRALQALAKTRDEGLLQLSLEFALSDEVRGQDTHYLISSVGRNDLGSRRAWEFVKQNWSVLESRYGGQFLLLGRIVAGATANFASEEQAKDIEDFFASGKNVAGIERTIEQTTEVIRARAEWTKKDGTAVGRWLLAHYGSVAEH